MLRQSSAGIGGRVMVGVRMGRSWRVLWVLACFLQKLILASSSSMWMKSSGLGIGSMLLLLADHTLHLNALPPPSD